MAWGALAWAIVSFVISTGVSYASQKKAQKAAKKAADAAKGVLVNRDGTNEQIPVIYGTRRVGGVRVYATSAEGGGSLKNDQLYLVLVLCEGPVAAITDIYVNGEPLLGSKYEQFVTITTYLGSDSQTANSTLVGLGDGWTSNHRLQGLAYIIAQCGMSSSDENPWTGGLPEITALVKGRTVFDPRTGTTAWSSNAALCIRDYLTNTRYGKGLATSRINDTLFNTAANLLDGSKTLYTAPDAGTVGTILTVEALYGVSMLTFVGDVAAAMSIGGTITSSTKTGVVTYAYYDAIADVTSVFYTPGSGTFAVGNVVSTSASAITGASFGCHAVLDTNDTLFDNTVKLLMGCKGFLPYTNGKYGLVIDDTGSSQFSFTTDHIEGGIRVNGVDKKDKYNQVTITFADPSQAYQPNQIVFPAVGSATDTALLAEDGGERLGDEIEVETIASADAAYNLAKTYLYRSRFNIKVAFVATSEALALSVGDVIDITHAGLGWSAELFKIEAMSLNYDGTVQVDAREYNSTPYVFDSLGPIDFTTSPKMPSTAATPPTALVLTESSVISSDGTLQPSIQVSWTASLDSFVSFYEVEWKASAATEYFSVIVSNPRTTLTGLTGGFTYNVRVRAVNGWGGKSTWITGSEAVDGDLTAPSAPSALSATGGVNAITLAWTDPTATDYDYVEVYRHTSNVSGSATLIARSFGTTFVNTGLSTGTTYYYWLKAVDYSGNKSAFSTVASASVTTDAAAAIADIAADDKLTGPEKTATRAEWNRITSEYNQLIVSAGNLGISTTSLTTNYDALGTYLNAGVAWNPGDATPSWIADANMAVTTTIVGATFRTNWNNYYNAANVVVEDINDVTVNNKALITELSADDKLTGPEKSTLRIEWNRITSEYNQLITSAGNLGISTTSLTTNYDALGTYLNAGTAWNPGDATPSWIADANLATTTTIVGATFRTNWNNYYTAANAVLDDINDVTVNNKSMIADFSADDKLTGPEKSTVRVEWDRITSEYNELVALAGTLSLSTAAYTADYDALGTYLNAGVAWNPGDATPSWIADANMAVTTTIVGATFRTNWNNYYDEVDNLRTAINNSNVNVNNPIDSGNYDDLIADNVITAIPEIDESAATAGSGYTSWVVYSEIQVTRTGATNPVVLSWSLALDYSSSDVIVYIRLCKYNSAGTTLIRTLGETGQDYHQEVVSGVNTDAYDDFAGYGNTYTYKLEAQYHSSISSTTRLIGENWKK